jgi:beta-lactamase superfamily II metal-dependent hydrolase
MLLTGDSEAGERAFWEAGVPQLVQGCTVLKLVHHGSRNGTDARWLATVKSQIAVASLGRSNEFGTRTRRLWHCWPGIRSRLYEPTLTARSR